MPLLHDSVIDSTVVGEGSAARPAVYELLEAHDSRVRNVPERIKTKRSLPSGTYCSMTLETPNDRLRKARAKAGFQTPREAADRFAWPYGTYKSHENGMRGLRRETAVKYAKAFKVSLTWLLTGQGSPQDDALSPDERALLEKYRMLDEQGQKAAYAVTDALVKSLDKPKKSA